MITKYFESNGAHNIKLWKISQIIQGVRKKFLPQSKEESGSFPLIVDQSTSAKLVIYSAKRGNVLILMNNQHAGRDRD